MNTEKYTVSLFGMDRKQYSKDEILTVWEECANREYQESKIYVTVLVDVKLLLCGEKRGCDLYEEAYVITSVRNPVEGVDSTLFFEALKRVIAHFRSMLGNPCMTIGKEQIEFYYFIQR
ncbi:hypothetical protein [Hominifimenecus sp. rT4P-3]|uniref:hypothetical protein n=1 Tax=Hominifimenecus sp. rT4P-3 TaxID=3242979 RepID=UPI003DA4E2D5